MRHHRITPTLAFAHASSPAARTMPGTGIQTFHRYIGIDYSGADADIEPTWPAGLYGGSHDATP